MLHFRYSLAAMGAASTTIVFAAPALAAGDDQPTIIVTAVEQRPATPVQSAVTIDRERIERTVNAVNVEDALKYLPSLIVRKRHIGDTQAPVATRTSGLGSSARSLIYADGALLSTLIGNNNGTASPQWALVSPEEIERVDVLYGPFSAAYPGNAIGAVINITTRLPDKLEASLKLAHNVQAFNQYATHSRYSSTEMGGTAGDRFGPLSLFASFDNVDSRSQPLAYVTALRPASTSEQGTPVSGAFDDRNRLGQPILVLGAGGLEHQRQNRFKLKTALDIGPGTRLTYVGGLLLNDTEAHAETYLSAGSSPAYAGAFSIGGRMVTVAPSAFSANVYHVDQRHWSHALSASGTSAHVDWRIIGTLFDYARDTQRSPTAALPGAGTGGPGTITSLRGTGWKTIDANATLRAGPHGLSLGAHGDLFRLSSNRFTTTDWMRGAPGTPNLRSAGRTRTLALWAQDRWAVSDALSLTVGGRYEWWRASAGENYLLQPAPAPAIDRRQPVRSAARFSPKLALAFVPAEHWTLRLSYGQAWRFPTVGELYQLVTSPVAATPNPDLRPERARSEELAIERRDDAGFVRLALFNEQVRDALISQTGPLNTVPVQIGTFVQNVGRTRARGIELAFDRRDLVPGVDVTGSVTHTDATTRANAVFPASVGKRLPSVPKWKATLVATYKPTSAVSLTAAARYASRSFGTLDNSDVVGNTYQGFYKYLVADVRAELRLNAHMALGLGVDNLFNDRYFLFHPFPQRSFQADLRWKL